MFACLRMMKRMRSESQSIRRFKLSHLLMGLATVYLIIICLRFPQFFESATGSISDNKDVGKDGLGNGVEEDSELSKPRLSSVYKDGFHRILQNNVNQNAPAMPHEEALEEKKGGSTPVKPVPLHYGRIAAAILRRRNRTSDFSIVERMADEAWALGTKAWEEVDKYDGKEIEMNSILEGKPESCPSWVSVNGEELARGDNIMFLPCGLAAGSSITVIGTPRMAHQEYVPQLARLRTEDSLVLVSQFMVELQGLKAVVGEDPPKILHLNPRLRGDWSHRPVIEHNTCYRMQWGGAQRCDGLPSKNEDDMLVDGYLKCEKWMRNDNVDSKESKIFSWFERFIGRAKMPEVTWPFPFMEGRMFVLTVRAGVEGYHINVGGRHVTSFPYRTDCDRVVLDAHIKLADAADKMANVVVQRYPFPLVLGYESYSSSFLIIFAPVHKKGLFHVKDFLFHFNPHIMTSFAKLFTESKGFTLEDATGLAIKGDVDVHSVHATSLPTSHPSFSPQRVLDFSEQWKSRLLPPQGIKLFIGVLSATNHFAERMAVRKTWMQSSAIRSTNVVVRFFVALNPRKEVNAVLKKEAAYFGDIVIIPFMDRYELVVLKTIAICEYGVQNVTAAYIMKVDDDTFVRVDTVLKEIEGVSPKRSIYMGNLNLLHRPLRTGKWAVSYKEWPEEIYPPYANGPGYIISSDVAKYIVSQHMKRSLRLFKMEDVSMGMWVEQFNSSTQVQYSHSWKFCQYGCMENYFTAHYQSPRQMLCLWANLVKGRARCCNY